jgi:excisionase family DNA binding protein
VLNKDRYNRNVNEFLTPEEVAEILRINVMTVYGYIQKDSLNAIRLGRKYRISSQDLALFLDSKCTRVRKAEEKD